MRGGRYWGLSVEGVEGCFRSLMVVSVLREICGLGILVQILGGGMA